MKTRGEYTVDSVTYGVLIEHSKVSIEAVLINAGTIVSAFKSDLTGMYSYNNVRAKELVNLIKNGIKGCTSKNCTPVPFALGAANMHEFIKSKVEYTITLHMGELAGAYIQSDNKRISLDYSSGFEMPSGIQYIKLTEVKVNMEENSTDDDLDAIPVRSVSEIALEKEDVSWLKNKKYYVVNDDKTAEDLFSYIENYGGIVSYDTETTGLNINCFGKIGSKYKKTLEQYNEEHPNEKIRADRLVGIIFCVEPDVSYYFPCFNRKFKNLYQDLDSPYRKKIIQNTKARYRVGDLRIDGDADMRDYVLSTPDDEWDLGVILMERVRNILTRCHLVAHHGSFEYAVGLQYGIDTNLKDDTMLMHQLMYKFRSTTRNSGEPSNLKYLAKRELGIDQWELGDFFPSFKEDASGTVRTKSGKSKKKKKSSVRIDFSYMDYEGTRVYAPTDGDVTLQLCYKYKKDMAENHRDMEYIYSVEVIVSMAIGYMEFYGHRIDESKIKEAKHLTMAKIVMLESELRQLIEYADDKEYTEYNNLKNMILSLDGLEKKDKDLYNEEIDKIPAACDKLRKVIDENTEKQINLSAPGQVADLLYNVLGYPMQGDKPSVAKKEIKALLKEKNEDGTPKYPAADIYSRYKSEETLQTKFFDNLGSFMYPGGFIFSKYGQIAAATGRMSCIYENSLISTINGGKPIKEIEPGEQVYAYDSNGALITNKVISRICNGERECIELQFHEHDNKGGNDKGDNDNMGKGSKGKGNGNETKRLKCTPDHRIRLASGKWKQAQKLKPGDIVSGQEVGGTKAEYILEKTMSIGSHMVYDLEVENNHNFIASGICVHNCSKPNAQQYPKVISKIVIPRDGYIMIDADYSQIEYRVLTALAKNTYLAEMFADPDSDYHTLMASLMYGVDYAAVDKSMRSSAKSFNFGIPYGMGFKSLAILLTGNSKPESVEEAKEKYELYFANQPKTRVFFDTLKEQAQVNGFTTTLFKRRRDYSFVDKDGNIDNRRKAAALRQAGNSVIQGTAADIFKIGVARNFLYIRKNKLLGKLLIVNMIHDEQLMEVDVQSLNAQRVLADIGKNMQFKIEGFPPLYIGAGAALAWGYAKDKMAEIHPVLLDTMTDESQSISIFRGEDETGYVEPKEVIAYFNKRIYEFRRNKVATYLSNPDNWGKEIHPEIGSLINLQFNYGRGESAERFKKANGEKCTDQEFLEMNIADFISENNINAKAEYFKANEVTKLEAADAKEKDKDDYDDNGDNDEFDIDSDIIETEEDREFRLISEEDKLFGSSVHDIINIFGCCLLREKRVCGISTKNMNGRQLDKLLDFLSDYMQIAETDEQKESLRQATDNYELIFLSDSNVLKYTGIYVSGLTNSELNTAYKSIISDQAIKSKKTTGDYSEGDIDNRSQAK